MIQIEVVWLLSLRGKIEWTYILFCLFLWGHNVYLPVMQEEGVVQSFLQILHVGCDVEPVFHIFFQVVELAVDIAQRQNHCAHQRGQEPAAKNWGQQMCHQFSEVNSVPHK